MSSKSDDVSGNLQNFISTQLPAKLKPAMMQAVSLVQESAMSKAPHDTGNLARSIEVKVSEDGKEGVIFSNCEYAPYVEIGTGIHSTKGTGRKDAWRYKGRYGWVTTKGTKAQPYLEPAMQERKQDVLDCFKGLF